MINNSVAALPQRQKADSEFKLANAVSQSFKVGSRQEKHAGQPMAVLITPTRPKAIALKPSARFCQLGEKLWRAPGGSGELGHSGL